MPTGADRRRSLFIGMTRRPATDPNGKPLPFDNQSLGHCSLSTRPDRSRQSSPTRRRNLFVSSSVLLLLGASIGMLVISNRACPHLAAQQMEFVAGVSHELRTRSR